MDGDGNVARQGRCYNKNMTNLIEIFSSAQGEGKYVGCRQVFIRTADCNLHCGYCDTNFNRADFCNVETFAGSMKFTQVQNPLDAVSVADIVKNFCAQVPTHSVSFTGGEPLLHGDFIADVAAALKGFCDAKIFLETNGTLAAELEKILSAVDIISMDIKFPSVTGVNLFKRHREFLSIARTKDLCVKAVISAETSREEFLKSVELVAEVSPSTLFVLQPVTPAGNVKAASPQKVLDFQATALKVLRDVRIIPQTHKLVGNW